MTELADRLDGDLVVVHQLGDLALVESFWGKYLGKKDGLYRFRVTRAKEHYSRSAPEGEILVNPSKITRVMRSEGSSYETTWKRDMGLDANVQSFYDALSDACDIYCSGYAGVQVEVFFKEERKPLYGKISHEKLDEGMLDARSDGNSLFALDTFGSTTIIPIDSIEKIMVYSWPKGATGGRSEEIGWQSPLTPSSSIR